jgi:sRNA-binding protein
MARSPKYDPLEAAKVTAETRAKDDATLDRKDWASPAAKTQTPSSDPDPLPPAPQSAAPRVMFEVLATKLASLGRGQVHKFKAGDLLNPVDYGGEAALQKLGLDLKRVEVG